jgi:hypothetical protein
MKTEKIEKAPIKGAATWLWDFVNNAVLGVSIHEGAHTSTIAGSGVDLELVMYQGFLIAFLGTMTDGTHTVTLTESKNDNTADASGTADVYTTLANGPSVVLGSSDTVQLASFTRTKRYVKATSTVSGATTGGVYGVLLGGQKKIY